MRVGAAAVLWAALGIAVQLTQPQAFFPVGVLLAPEHAGSREYLSRLARMRFNMLAVRDKTTGEVRPSTVNARLAGAVVERIPPRVLSGMHVVPVRRNDTPEDVRLHAWQAIAAGARCVIFDGSSSFDENPGALAAAASFADNVTRNAALFAPLEPRGWQTEPRVDLGRAVISARFLESAAAMVLIAANLTSSAQRATMTFSAETPEAVWQNMETGAAVNFVAGPDGPIYVHTFAPSDVLVLMIRKQYK